MGREAEGSGGEKGNGDGAIIIIGDGIGSPAGHFYPQGGGVFCQQLILPGGIACIFHVVVEKHLFADLSEL